MMTKAMSQHTFLWHDYETWGVDPALDKPSQFAAIRTDEHFHIVGEPEMFYCKPAPDTIPHPEACLVTGITPQTAWEQGVAEVDFAKKINQLMTEKNTCVVGYNNIRFDDEVTRHLFFRNFYDSYEHEWKNGNSRFDLIDVVRLCAALRPEGIEWPRNDEDKPSFKLEHLTAANNIEQDGAHDALVDVKATIGLAALIKEKQPKLLDWALKLRSKQFVLEQLQVGQMKPVVHVSGMIKSELYHASLLLPLAQHPDNKNAIICYDLRHNPEELLALSADAIRERLYMSAEERGDKPRIALKNIHINKCPMIAPVSMLDEAVASRIQLDLNEARQFYQILKLDQSLAQKVQAVFKRDEHAAERKVDVEKSLYSGGFLNAHDKALCKRVRTLDGFNLAAEVEQGLSFDDERLNTLLFRYQARNFPETMTEAQMWRWRDYCMAKFSGEDALASNSILKAQQRIEAIAPEYTENEAKLKVLQALWQWLEKLQS